MGAIEMFRVESGELRFVIFLTTYNAERRLDGKESREPTS